MSNTYKGFPIPEIMQDDFLYHIICDEGIFDGYSEQAVLQHWKNKVDTILRLRAIEDGYIELPEDRFACSDCGALVWDVYSHKTFHENLTN